MEYTSGWRRKLGTGTLVGLEYYVQYVQTTYVHICESVIRESTESTVLGKNGGYHLCKLIESKAKQIVLNRYQCPLLLTVQIKT